MVPSSWRLVVLECGLGAGHKVTPFPQPPQNLATLAVYDHVGQVRRDESVRLDAFVPITDGVLHSEISLNASVDSSDIHRLLV